MNPLNPPAAGLISSVDRPRHLMVEYESRTRTPDQEDIVNKIIILT